MKILCHRGWWNADREPNSLTALFCALDNGYGIETDVRDCCGEIVISHDMPSQSCTIELDKILDHYVKINSSATLALNVKSDGLQHKLRTILNKYSIHNYFVFDMSIPDTLPYMHNGMSFAIRLSEYEHKSSLYRHASYVWLDAFESIWYDNDLVMSLIQDSKKVCIVSSELHKRDQGEHWRMLSQLPDSASDSLFICTDYIEQARDILNAT